MKEQDVKIWIEPATKRPHQDEGFYAHIVTAEFDHHGYGKTPSKALMLAAAHWHSHASGR